MGKASYYAYKAGDKSGICSSWSECESAVKGVPNAKYKKFGTEEDAHAFLEELNPEQKQSSDKSDINLQKTAYEHLSWLKDNRLISDDVYSIAQADLDRHLEARQNASEQNISSSGKHIDIYVDGSYNSETNDYGYGVYMNDGKNRKMLYGRGQCSDGGRNVEGEVAASKAALSAVRDSHSYDSVTIHHDYMGIGEWADGNWKTNKAYTKEYASFVKDIRDSGIDIKFSHVAGHTGQEGNEIVDKLAKIACGVPVTSSERAFLNKYRNVPGFPGNNSSSRGDELQIPSYDSLESTGCVFS